MGMRRYEHTWCLAGWLMVEQFVAHRHSYTITDLCNSMGLTLLRLGLSDIFSFSLDLVVHTFPHCL